MDALPFAFWAAVASSMTSCVSGRGQMTRKALLCSDQLRCLRVCDQMLATLRESDRYSNRSRARIPCRARHRVRRNGAWFRSTKSARGRHPRARRAPPRRPMLRPRSWNASFSCSSGCACSSARPPSASWPMSSRDVLVCTAAPRRHPIASHVQRAGTQLAAHLVARTRALRQTDVFLEGLLTREPRARLAGPWPPSRC